MARADARSKQLMLHNHVSGQQTMRRRRIITVPAYIMAWSLWLAAAPLWLVLAAVVDCARRSPGVAIRSGALVMVYLSCEVAGIFVSAGIFCWKRIGRIDEARWTDLHYRLETWWGTTLLDAVVWLFDLRVEVEADADLARGPYLLLLRHASTADTLLASEIVSRRHALRLRYVLKRELLWDPCLDIVGQRLPNVFVDRNSDDSAQEIERLQQLARDLGQRDGILIYPEGTRFSRAKRNRVLERFGRNGDTRMSDYARSLSFVLPPRPAGTLALLEAAPEADVVICAHTGFESAESLARIWKGELAHQLIRVKLRRIPRSEIPSGREDRITWLFDEWRKVDSWVERNRASAGGENGPDSEAGEWR